MSFKSGFLGMVLAGSALFAGINYAVNHADTNKEEKPAVRSLESAATQPDTPKQILAKKLDDLKFEDKNLERLNVHDKDIIEFVDWYNRQTKPTTELTYREAKAMICTETGHKRYQKTAFAHDPTQVANKGDFGLTVVRNKQDNVDLLKTDFSDLTSVVHTPRVNGEWKYGNNTITSRQSIKAGLAFLYSKAIIPGCRSVDDSTQERTYKVKKGDNPGKIANALGTTSRSIIEHNPGLNSKNLQVGQVITYVPAHMEKYIASWKTADSWRNVILAYNGGGNKNHGSNFDYWMNKLKEGKKK